MSDSDHLVDTWRSIIAGDGKSWVVFEHGTCVVFAEAGTGDLATRAVDVLREFGPVRTGTPAADFGTITLEETPGWVVTGHHPDVLTFVSPDEVDQHDTLVVGLTGRAKRDQDGRSLTVVHVEQLAG
ncbi:hypothetical protein ACQP2F_23215 [Actinoplanes sp. CA-030573]|uniref:hypothetical protein n=1 Tax=Actinoplanes sp. CA-030573 TaxID=3239898 RepID=UPI003D916E0E